MPSPRESAIVNQILERAKRVEGLVLRKRHGSPFGITGDPDIYGVFCGRHVECEVKRPGEQPTLLQIMRLAQWRQGGAISFWVTGADEFFDRLLTKEKVEDGEIQASA